MRKYCKAYYLKDLRQFANWKENNEENTEPLTDESVCYVWDDFIVVKSPVLDKGVIYDDITPEWIHFCQDILKFEIPADLQAPIGDDEKQTANTVNAESDIPEKSTV